MNLADKRRSQMNKLYRNEEYNLRIRYADGSWDIAYQDGSWMFYPAEEAEYFEWLAIDKHYTLITKI